MAAMTAARDRDVRRAGQMSRSHSWVGQGCALSAHHRLRVTDGTGLYPACDLLCQSHRPTRTLVQCKLLKISTYIRISTAIMVGIYELWNVSVQSHLDMHWPLCILHYLSANRHCPTGDSIRGRYQCQARPLLKGTADITMYMCYPRFARFMCHIWMRLPENIAHVWVVQTSSPWLSSPPSLPPSPLPLGWSLSHEGAALTGSLSPPCSAHWVSMLRHVQAKCQAPRTHGQGGEGRGEREYRRTGYWGVGVRRRGRGAYSNGLDTLYHQNVTSHFM